MESLQKFYVDGEWTQEQVNVVNSNAKLAQIVLETVRRNADDKTTTDKKAKAKKIILATPKSGTVKAKNKPMSDEEKFYGKP